MFERRKTHQAIRRIAMEMSDDLVANDLEGNTANCASYLIARREVLERKTPTKEVVRDLRAIEHLFAALSELNN